MSYLPEYSRSVPKSWLLYSPPSSSSHWMRGRYQMTGNSSEFIPSTRKAPAVTLETTDL